jgi:hypothetical protein
MKFFYKISFLFFIGLFPIFYACSKDISTDNSSEEKGGYLFAHMTPSNYGHLYYSVSRDGLHWKTLNKGEEISSSFLGHPSIVKGRDNNYYMIGVSTSGDLRYPILWYTSDLINWKQKKLERNIFDVSSFGYSNENVYIGAPKIFYDEDRLIYMITWHAYKTGTVDNAEWESMRTYYILTKDWETFTPAKRLFNFTGSDENMATIDAIICKVGNIYYAIMKDERWPDKYPAVGKTIRIAKSNNLTGPYSNPGAAITPSWHEAPTVIQSSDGKEWYLYTEHYTVSTYDLFESSTLDGGMWKQVTFSPPIARHGCVIKVDEKTYQGLLNAYEK